MNAIRVGLIGTGFGSAVQAPGWQCIAGAELVAVTSARLERAQQVADEHGLSLVYDDYREMIRAAKLDLVSITAPPYLHHEMVMAALEAGAHVLCEKPFAMNVGQAQAMLDAAERLGRVHAIDHEFRFIPARLAMKRMIDEGEIGEVFLIRIADLVTRGGKVASWWIDREQGGGLLQAIGSHLVDAVQQWVSPIDRLSADVRAVVPEKETNEGPTKKVTADDSAFISFRLENGASGRIDISIATRGGLRRMELYGTKGTLVLEGTTLYKATDGELAEVEPQQHEQGRLEDPRLGPFVELAQRVADRINGKDSGAFPTFADGVRVQRVMDAIHLSSDENREVKLSEI